MKEDKMIIKLKHRETGKVKYIRRLPEYPAVVGEEIRFKKWESEKDTWEIVSIKTGK